MKIYFAGAESFKDLLFDNGVENILVSYWSLKKVKDITFLQNFEDVFLDSGGFSARNAGASINVKKYADFIKKFQFKTYANLDVKDTETTLENQKYLESQGLSPIPVYHMDEWLDKKIDLLEEYIKTYPYIAVGGVAGAKTGLDLICKYLDYIFSKTQNKIKVHGFGMTSLNLIKKYPFYSVDSTNWLNGGKFNNVMRFRNGQIDKLTCYKPLHSHIRNGKNIQETLKIQDFINKLWEKRGVIWKE